MAGNFKLLEQRWPQLASFAQYAKGYAYTDPQSSLTKLRCFCEAIVGVLYRELSLPCEPRTNLIDKLKSDEFIEVVDDDVCQTEVTQPLFNQRNQIHLGCSLKAMKSWNLSLK